MSKIINNEQTNENGQNFDSLNVLTKDLEDSSVKEFIKLEESEFKLKLKNENTIVDDILDKGSKSIFSKLIGSDGQIKKVVDSESDQTKLTKALKKEDDKKQLSISDLSGKKDQKISEKNDRDF